MAQELAERSNTRSKGKKNCRFYSFSLGHHFSFLCHQQHQQEKVLILNLGRLVSPQKRAYKSGRLGLLLFASLCFSVLPFPPGHPFISYLAEHLSASSSFSHLLPLLPSFLLISFFVCSAL
ncbi:hypothetical protein BKA57DRAFT_462198 [Linnemannia elongata]|nr:hypothetical protein BKA57DRAFT_462198 [Linnemannia elongata]